MSEVRFGREDAVAVITIDSPEVKNALTPEMGSALIEICDEIDRDPTIGAAVVRGANDTFCSGADRRRWRPDLDQSEETSYRELGLVYSAFMRIGELLVPTIAAVRGAAVGAGLNLMLSTDLRVVARDARLLAGFLRIGLHPGGGFFTIANRAMGREATAAAGLFGAEISGEQAVELGLAWKAVAAAEVEDAALELAAVPAADPALAREAARSFRAETERPGMPWSTAMYFERAPQMWSMRRRSEP